ncbi:MAG: hypothetical protein QMD14_00530 [Candidatus Aenigmarchaeota archaeon]|nr:hypothetical protein [Candidatus Aenigmarchaeota archaeon]
MKIKKEAEKSSIAEQTFRWIKNHPFIIYGLKKDLINFSSLSRKIQKDTGIKNFDAILVAIRRYQKQIKSIEDDKKIIEILKNSKLEIRTGVNVYTMKSLDGEMLKDIKHFHLITGIDKVEVITDHNLDLEPKMKNVVEVRIISSTSTEMIPGVVAYVCSAFAERGINILKMYSCHGDVGTFVFNKKDLLKVVDTLESIGVQ